jgi:phospholipase/lecithinase/hemolysin
MNPNGSMSQGGKRLRSHGFCAVALFLLAVPLAVTAQSLPAAYSAVIVYGDSYSDNGNVFRVLGWPGAPYWNGRFSNGPVAIEDLASNLNARLLDFAWAGATTGVGNVVDGGTPERLGNRNLPGMTTSINQTLYSIPPSLIRSALWVVWGSPNDFAADGYTTATADAAVRRALAIVADLQRLGAQRILVAGMCDLGVVPEYFSQGPQYLAFLHMLSAYFNQKLTMGLPRGVMYYNTYALYDRVVANPGAYGLTNATDPCYNNGVVCPNPNQYFFWDGAHPTAQGHTILAQRFYATVTGGFPPP